MSPLYLNSPLPSHVPFNQDLCSNHLSYTILENTHDHHHHGHDHHHYHEALSLEYSWNPRDKVDKVLSYDDHKSNDVGQSSSWPQNYMMDGSGCSYVHSSSSISHGKIKIVTNNEQKNCKKWKPSKARIMQKMTSTTTSKNTGVQHDPEPQRYRNTLYRNNNNNNNNGVRVCVDCNTTTTPLWRSGPQGPKTLCNACGIRQRKARRAAMVAVTVTESSPSSSVSIELRETILHPLPLKKRGKITTFEDAMNNNNNGYIKAMMSQRGFPQDDEEEGAILLMALSCGLACSS